MEERIPYVGLKNGEKILWFGRQSLISYMGRIILSIVLMILGIIPYIGFILFIIGILILISVVISSRANFYYITNFRIIHERRLFGRSIKETTLDQVTDIVFQSRYPR